MSAIRQLNSLGTILWWDAAAFVGLLIAALAGTFGRYEEYLYYPIALGCIIPLGVGWLFAAYHLIGSELPPDERARAWNLLLWSGPFGPGLYLSRLDENAAR